ERAALAEGGYILRRGAANGAVVLAGAGRDDLGDQYAAYALLDRLGFGFFHPLETYVPEGLQIPAALEETWAPGYVMRGMHVHTMHPIEMNDTLLVPSAEHLEEARRYVDWLVANRQNFFQWVLQDTVDLDAWIPHAQAILAYAHERALRVGVDTPLQFIQQNGFVLVPDPGPYEPQIVENLARVLRAPFDVINIELGAGEFIPSDDLATMGMMNFAAEHLDAVYGVEITAKVHVSEGQTAPNFGDINFNFLPGLADPRVGVMPHTVQFYDLFRVAPTYDNEDLSFMREFLLGEIGERAVYYYPETAYWVSFDVDVPLFLPHYVFARWNDLNRLAGTGMEGQINFSSGFEWGYWLNDWATAAFAYEPLTDWRAYLEKFTRIFGAAAGEMQALLVDLIDEQGADLLEDNLVAYLIGWDSADSFGDAIVDFHAQPDRPRFEEIRAMGADDLEAYAADLLPRLAALEETYDGFVARVRAAEPRVPEPAAKWYREVRRGIEVTALRTRHVHGLYEGTILKTRERLGTDPDGEETAALRFADAQAARREAEALVALQEDEYRWPKERIARLRENPSAYEFGYLYKASDRHFWRREELQAIDDNDCICLGNLENLIATLVGEGHPLDLLARNFPISLGPCLDQCLKPIERIEDLGGSQ
ncbi:MAG: hypothetical protein K8I02_01605, partial [Candidatus Methylomirabilis sp.]|nr:hypothetical protein [Deltaproteobacteria bacterium]